MAYTSRRGLTCGPVSVVSAIVDAPLMVSVWLVEEQFDEGLKRRDKTESLFVIHGELVSREAPTCTIARWPTTAPAIISRTRQARHQHAKHLLQVQAAVCRVWKRNGKLLQQLFGAGRLENVQLHGRSPDRPFIGSASRLGE